MVSNENQELPEIFTKFSSEKTKEWNDISLNEMLGKFSDLKDLDRKDKWFQFTLCSIFKHSFLNCLTELTSSYYIQNPIEIIAMDEDLLGLGVPTTPATTSNNQNIPQNIEKPTSKFTFSTQGMPPVIAKKTVGLVNILN